MNKDDVRAAVEGAFGAGAFELISDGAGESDDSNSQSLESVVANIDAGMAGKTETQSARDNQTQDGNDVDRQRYLMFRLGDSLLAVEMSNVLEIGRIPNITAIPHTPNWLQGVTNLRGAVLSVVDLGSFLATDASEVGKNQRMMVVHSLVDDISVGLLVDEVIGIRNFVTKNISPPTAPLQGQIASFLHGVIDFDNNLVSILDIERMLVSSDLRQFD